jgi:hypothetical protein
MPAMGRDDEEQVEEERDKQAAAKSEGKPKAPEQDETASTTWDTDQHSDAPGPTGTG